MYRPEGMRENPYNVFKTEDAAYSFQAEENACHIAYEAGADAMLEGLRKESSTPDHCEGKWVYIPEEE